MACRRFVFLHVRLCLIKCFFFFFATLLSSDRALKHPLSAAERNSPVGKRG